ncbi:EAL domain-containing protein [Candidatus Halobeggiatoa sp. HSG11]|nr:EAL domain-containing protein [Candidatus Halobeggiatoa sp. HSG11]
MKIFIIIIFIFSITNLLAQELKFQNFSLDEGLSQSTVNAILQDKQGFIWFGTQDGLNKFDGYTFTVYRHDPKVPDTLSHNEIFSIYEDNQGILWIGTGNGLNKFDRHKFTSYLHDPNNPNSLSNNMVWSIYEDSQGILWIGTNGGGLNKFDGHKFTHYLHDPNDPNSLSHDSVWSIYEDSQGVLWIGTNGGGLNKFEQGKFKCYLPAQKTDDLNNIISSIYESSKETLWIGTLGGLHKFNRQQETFTSYFYDSNNINGLSSRAIWNLKVDIKNNLWIATDGGGLNLYNFKQDKFLHFKHNPQNPNSLSSNIITSIYRDRADTMWVGTNAGGVNQFNYNQNKFIHYFNDPKNLQSLNSNHVLSIYEDKQGMLWVGTTENGLNKFSLDRKTVTHYQHDKNNPNSLSDNEVITIYEDNAGIMWFGTSRGGLNRFDRKQFTNYKNQPENPNSLSDNWVSTIYEDHNNVLWIGTRNGLNKFDRKNKFSHYRHDSKDINSLSSNYVSSIYEDSFDILWIGTQGKGLNKFNHQQNNFTRYQHDEQDTYSLSHNEVSTIYEDKAKTLWIGTLGNGLNKFDRNLESFKTYQEIDGLANNVVYGILEGETGNLWLSSNKGLSKFNPTTEKFKNYDVLDGLQSNEFNKAHHKSRTGELFFGGIKGFNSFYPQQIEDNLYVPPIVITDFKIFNKSINLGADSPLQQDINLTKEITLSYEQSFFSFQFAALNFLQTTKNQYAYKLEGFENDWNQVNKRRAAYYTNVPHGVYTFRVKGSNNDGIWNETGKSIKITILPPPWKTWWAYILYVLIVLTIIISYVQSQKRKLWEKQLELEREKEIAAQLKEADRVKDEFLANTSHELRTPLNGIIGIAESLVDGATGQLSKQTNTNLSMIVSSGLRLLNLVNDILDFSKLKKQEFDLQLKAVDTRTIAEVVLALSQPLIGNKQVQLINKIPANLPPINADENRLQQILYNLVGNAIKFTDAGIIRVSAEIVENVKLVISVSDTGIGIPEEKIERIFEAFAQADGSTARIYGGTGLGLAVTQQLINLHHGQMTVKSEVGVGSTFSFSLPISKEKVSEQTNTSQLSVISHQLTNDDIEITNNDLQSEFSILIVDDEQVNRQVLINYLSLHNYSLHQVDSGIEALEYLKQEKPDIILLDVMMPHMSGYEVTQKIRTQWQADELPIILLTAKNQVADLVVGLESGANDYLTKPVSKDELLARIKTHLNILQLKQDRLEAEQKYRNIFENAIEGIFQCTLDGHYLSVNPACISMFGYESAEQMYTEIIDIGKQLYFEPQRRIEFIELLATNSNVQDFEYQARCKNGTIIWVKETVHVVRNNENEIKYYEGIIENITERKQTEEKLRYDATHDQLTGLLNRTSFTDSLTDAIAQDDAVFAVLFVDLDRFKIVNDSMGHLVGDRLLTDIAERLSKEVTDDNIVARFGGDEFALIFKNIPDLQTLEQNISNILYKLSQPYPLKDETFNTTASIGIALSNSEYKTADEMLRDADTAMYEAKKQGGDKSVIFQPWMRTTIVNMLKMEGDLRKALERDELMVYYQPIISLETHKLIGFEALVRWQHPQQGLITPDSFIPLAEETGLIKELGLWVFETACIQLSSWQQQFTAHSNLGMNINVSPVQLKQPDLIYQIQDIIDKYNIKPDTCRIEITENAMMQNPKTALKILNDLKNLDILLYIDDFGTGYSSLSYLQQFPIDALKIDKSFIQNIDASAKSAQIVNAIIALGKSFDLRIVAEGTENKTQVTMLKAANCHNVQGYFFSKPKDAETIEEFLRMDMFDI